MFVLWVGGGFVGGGDRGEHRSQGTDQFQEGAVFGPVGAVLLDAGGEQLEGAEFTGRVVQGAGAALPAVGAAFGEAVHAEDAQRRLDR
ncbi:hypothetical protein [Actinomadura atramentaria]|uniref:hypothetical protein n=1 Tax=Actinomadura atramentaria TaxID=1990 RepID=UPI00036756E5|nr:hypothetical protein [Actinomadura atramentaria]